MGSPGAAQQGQAHLPGATLGARTGIQQRKFTQPFPRPVVLPWPSFLPETIQPCTAEPLAQLCPAATRSKHAAFVWRDAIPVLLLDTERALRGTESWRRNAEPRSLPAPSSEMLCLGGLHPWMCCWGRCAGPCAAREGQRESLFHPHRSEPRGHFLTSGSSSSPAGTRAILASLGGASRTSLCQHWEGNTFLLAVPHSAHRPPHGPRQLCQTGAPGEQQDVDLYSNRC